MVKILFVEPDKSLGLVYKKYFSEMKYSVGWEQSADDAIKSIDKNCPDILVLELQITNHNGLELLYEVRSYPEWNDIKIILYTNIPESRLLKSPVYKLLNIHKYLYKPSSTLTELAECIKLASAK